MSRRSVSESVTPILGGKRVERRGAAVGLAAVLVPPAAWLLSLGLSYMLEDFGCTAAASAGAAAPAQPLLILLTVLNTVLLIVTLLAGAAGFLLARRSPNLRGRQVLAFLGYLGAVLALMFGFGILLIGAHSLFLEVCA